MQLETGNGEECKISRRGFLRLSGATLGTISLGSLPLAGCSRGAAIEFPNRSVKGVPKWARRF